MIARVSILLLCLCLAGPAMAAELEIAKDKDGTVTLKQKRDPKPVSPPVTAEPGEVQTPEQAPDKGPAPGDGAEKAPKKKEDGKPSNPPADPNVPAKRAAIEELNAYVNGYNERIKALQEESDQKYKDYLRRIERLKNRRDVIEETMRDRPKTFYARSSDASYWKGLAAEYNALPDEQRRINANWNETSASLERRRKAESDKLAAERVKILKKYNLKESDLQ
jgi:small-conductance mechanosensitive channel